MRMIAVSENERCPFLLEEPYWTDDTQVSCFVTFPFTQLDTVTRLLSSTTSNLNLGRVRKDKS